MPNIGLKIFQYILSKFAKIAEANLNGITFFGLQIKKHFRI